ncbi:hypothetical protein DFJ73DRAFT_831411 [Zopfochytrium polystomum]|nr:hypothetical protein DFJ73DRAFT_831411 [Zopfochytrium polystomum]
MDWKVSVSFFTLSCCLCLGLCLCLCLCIPFVCQSRFLHCESSSSGQQLTSFSSSFVRFHLPTSSTSWSQPLLYLHVSVCPSSSPSFLLANK